MINVVTVYKPNHHNQVDYKMNLPAQPSPVTYDIYSKSLSLIFFLKRKKKCCENYRLTEGLWAARVLILNEILSRCTLQSA